MQLPSIVARQVSTYSVTGELKGRTEERADQSTIDATIISLYVQNARYLGSPIRIEACPEEVGGWDGDRPSG